MLLWSSIVCWNKYLSRPTTDVCCSMIVRVASVRSSTVGIVCFWFLFALRGLGTSTSSFAKSFDILLKGMRLQTMQRTTQRIEWPREENDPKNDTGTQTVAENERTTQRREQGQRMREQTARERHRERHRYTIQTHDWHTSNNWQRWHHTNQSSISVYV